MIHELQFFVRGTPRPAGSKRALFKNGKALVFDMSGTNGKQWRRAIAQEARLAMSEASYENLGGPIGLTATFCMPRPKSHYDKLGRLRRDAPKAHTIRPDTTKLLRAIEDALTGVCWHDDAQVIEQQASKVYAAPDFGGVSIRVRVLR